MSRMQSILEKAEREGAVHRIRVFSDPMPAPAAAVPLAAAAPPDVVAPLPIPASRAITGTRLDSRLVTISAPHSTAAEQYRALRTRLTHGEGVGATGVILITSPGRGDGKSLTAANLGLAMAEEHQRRICVVDANLRSPSQQHLFGLQDGPGLSDVLEGRAVLDDALVTLDDHHVTVLPAGAIPSHPAELLGTMMMRRTLETLRSRFDTVIVDAPGAAPLADVGVLTPIVDGVIMVVRAGVTEKPAIHDALAALDGRVLGVVLNDTV
jgi:succinoglycan biosynthesis transport protein ExoP